MCLLQSVDYHLYLPCYINFTLLWIWCSNSASFKSSLVPTPNTQQVLLNLHCSPSSPTIKGVSFHRMTTFSFTGCFQPFHTICSALTIIQSTQIFFTLQSPVTFRPCLCMWLISISFTSAPHRCYWCHI